jgi:outer membrane protein, multidrug efflux system
MIRQNHSIAKTMLCFLCVGCLISLTSCASWKPKAVDRGKFYAPPSAYAGQKDTSQMSLSWRELFPDQSLRNLIDTALKRNLDRQIAYTNLSMGMADVLRAKAPFLPQTQVVTSLGAERFGDYTMNGVGNYDLNRSGNITENQKIPTPFLPDFYVGLRASWEIDIWGRLKNQQNGAVERLLAQRDGMQWLTTNIIAQVATLYYELLALDEEKKIADENIVLQERALNIIITQKEAGRATELAVQQFKAQVLGTQALRFQLQQRITSVENTLRVFLGQYEGAIERDSNWQVQNLPIVIKAGLPAKLLLNRPDVRQAEHDLAATKADLVVAKAAFLPTLTLTPNIGLQTFRPSTLLNPTSAALSAVGGLATPVLNRRGIIAERNFRMAKQDEAFLRFQQRVIQAFNEVQTELQQFQNLQESYRFKTEEVAALKRAVQTSNDLYLTGYASYLEVISAQKGVLQTSLELVEMRKAQFVNIVNIYRSLGGEQQ